MEQLSKVAFSDKFSTIKDENPTDRQNSVKKIMFCKAMHGKICKLL